MSGESFTRSSYKVYRSDDGPKIDLLCQHCKKWFTLDADDSVFVALCIGVAPRFNCGQGECLNAPGVKVVE